MRLLPGIHDITTTPEAPPQFRVLEREEGNDGRDMSYPPELAEAQRRAHPELLPLISDLEPQKLFEMVQAAALESPGWAVAAVEFSRLSFEAVVTRGLLRPRMDVVIQVRPDPGGGASVHMRCRARRRMANLGASAREVRAFLRRLSVKLH